MMAQNQRIETLIKDINELKAAAESARGPLNDVKQGVNQIGPGGSGGSGQGTGPGSMGNPNPYPSQIAATSFAANNTVRIASPLSSNVPGPSSPKAKFSSASPDGRQRMEDFIGGASGAVVDPFGAGWTLGQTHAEYQAKIQDYINKFWGRYPGPVGSGTLSGPPLISDPERMGPFAAYREMRLARRDSPVDMRSLDSIKAAEVFQSLNEMVESPVKDLNELFYGNPGVVKRGLGFLGISPKAAASAVNFTENLLSRYSATAIKMAGPVVAGVALADQVYEDLRDNYYSREEIKRMNPGLRKSKAEFLLERRKGEQALNAGYALAAGFAATGIGAPIGVGIAVGTYLIDKLGADYVKREAERVDLKASVEDIVRRYNLGDTSSIATKDGHLRSRTAEERARNFVGYTDALGHWHEGTFKNEAEFKAAVQEAQSDYQHGLERIGLGDFGDRIDQNGGMAYMRRAEMKIQGSAPMWFDPAGIFTMLDSARLASRQWASSQVPRAKNRTGQ